MDGVEFGNRILDFANRVRSVEVMDQLCSELLTEIIPFGLTVVASGMVSGKKAVSEQPFHYHNWPREWIEYYLSHDFLACDPIPRWARSSGRAVTWSDLSSSLPAKDRGRIVITSAVPFGFTEGIVIPARSLDNEVGVVSLGGARGPIGFAEQTFLTLISRMAFEAADRIEHGTDVPKIMPILTAREVECIELLVHGHSDHDIGKLLNMSGPTVRFHLNHAREKFGAISRTHLAALVVAQGYIFV